MRPISLRISAFGPYAGETIIPMDMLGEKGLYLITGDTGAGKTTIFDAICFALFGEPSGANRESSMFRSKYAEPDTPTEVELVFIHMDKEYKVKRNPEYMRPAKRGEGMKKETPNAELYMPDGTVITKVKDVNLAIEGLLGITRDQFSQIAMLAQGDFLKLLLADTRERQNIFRELFKTGFYQTLQFKLEENRKALYGQCEDAKKSVKQYISGVDCDPEDVLLLELNKAKADELTTEDTLELIDRILASDIKVKDKADEEILVLDKELEAVNQSIGKATEIANTKNALEKAKLSLAEEKTKEKVLKQEFDKAKEGLVTKEGLQKEMSLLEAELPNYTVLEDVSKAIAADTKAIGMLTDKLAKSIDDEKIRTAKLIELKEELKSLDSVSADREKHLANKEKLDTKKQSLDEISQRKTEVDNKKKEYEKAKLFYVDKDKEYRKLKAQYDMLDQAYRDGQAGILAEGLVDGEKCPVCGSTSHPEKAHKLDIVPTEAELNKAKDVADKARVVAEESSYKAGQLKSAAETMESELIKLAQKTIQNVNLEELETAIVSESKNVVESISAENSFIKDLNAKAKRKAELEESIPKLENEANQITKDISGYKEEQASLMSKLEAAKKHESDIRKKLKYESKSLAEESFKELKSRTEKLQSVYEQSEKNYNDEQQYINTLKGKISGYENSLTDSIDVDLSKENIKKNELSDKRSLMAKMQQSVNTRIKTNEAARTNILSKSEELVALEKHLQWVTTLSYTANGKLNGKEKIMLETYIQTTYFDRIIDRANSRLMTMSDGQYELMRMSEASNNRAQSGLELGVIDHYNGSQRSVKTLSGGESFMASLSLALGLSDEVQSSAGGIWIDTMFVDEGFGSLDPDSLELAYNALARLTEGNRLVGIISHVADLKDKIDKQIIITKKKSGGSFVQIIA